jgi:alpha-tubulin suppressor-like RCC1 family protein
MDHSCALTAAGAVKCWGDNPFGELGDGTRRGRLRPVAVTSLRGRVRALASGQLHSCALTAAGAVKCWGWNKFGQLGDGTTHDRLRPVAVDGLGGVRALALGRFHSCALSASGVVKCWGSNHYGQLGDGTGRRRLRPVPVAGLGRPVRAIASGQLHSCALTAAGGVKCWGSNNLGQLGDGTRHGRWRPVAVVGLGGGVRALASAANADYSCALTASAIKCWGANYHGSLGDGTTYDRLRPVAVAGLGGGVQALGIGGAHSCALTAARAVKCWGWNEYGQLGDGTKHDRLRPVAVAGLSRSPSPAWATARALALGFAHSCALTVAGTVECWGWNLYGQIGDGTTHDRLRPVAVVGFGPSPRCLVPDVRRQKLAAAKIALKRANCSLGNVRKAHSATVQRGRVVSEMPAPGTKRARGSKVNLVVSTGMRR